MRVDSNFHKCYILLTYTLRSSLFTPANFGHTNHWQMNGLSKWRGALCQGREESREKLLRTSNKITKRYGNGWHTCLLLLEEVTAGCTSQNKIETLFWGSISGGKCLKTNRRKAFSKNGCVGFKHHFYACCSTC